ncbi:MAG: NAD(P) transhydrogenase subunit alpha [Pirellulales bacterium]|nr:NAD(P) transhydrogenase subunit alpha [Pirellulales bacterium]
MHVAVLKETYPGERRVAVIPAMVPLLLKSGIHVQIEAGAGRAAGFLDSAYTEKGAEVFPDRQALFQSADVIVQVRCLGSNPNDGRPDLAYFREGQIVAGMCDPLGNPQAIRDLAGCGVTLFALELMPRITRAQNMDVRSSMAMITGYKAVLLAANHLPKMFPLMMTAGGTLKAAKVFVVGAGVAGLQAIATARRLGAIVDAYDVRPAAMEQIASLGGKPVELKLATAESEDADGYARKLTEEKQDQERALLANAIAGHDVCITTAAIPGQPSPLLVTVDAVRRMPPGSVIVDLAAELGGNCELTKADETVIEHDVTILGPTNLPSTLPVHASQLYAKNIAAFLMHFTNQGRFAINPKDQIAGSTLVAQGGQVVHPRIRELLGLGPVVEQTPSKPIREANEDDEYELEDPS